MSAGAEGLFRLRELRGESAETTALQPVLEAAAGYFQAVTGSPPGPAEAQITFAGLPPGRTCEDKRVYGLYAGEATIGAADVVRGWNRPDKAIIGRHRSLRRSSSSKSPSRAAAARGRFGSCPCPSNA